MFFANGLEATETRAQMRGGMGQAALQAIMPSGALPAKCRLASWITLEPGCSVGYHPHEGETEIYVVMQGQAQFVDDGTQIVGNPGDVLVTPSGHSHSVANAGGETLRLLAVIVLD